MSTTTEPTTTFAVDGMSCGHCERTVSAGLSGLPGVTEAAADAKAGRVTLTLATGRELDEEQVRQAVTEAGFAFLGRI
ncbi:heavy-metal-associated domain-containing protein [Kitasatospora sp. NPDC097643]|uniref:heavy-metal-associated domain-containing protein n=1 Tax=Kitasatospora sp. NPDC097643 TaxID=3157230 RepID=UPI00332EAE09